MREFIYDEFVEICVKSQKTLKAFMADVLTKAGYASVITEDGFLYAEGDLPVLLVAHLDTVHRKLPEADKIKRNAKGEIRHKDGIGGDDRCGVYVIKQIIKTHKPHILFCEDEEVGTVGAKKFTRSPYCKEVAERINFMVEIDRRGNGDAVYYSNGNKKFQEFISTVTGYKKDRGSFTDISDLMPATKIAGVNLSSGYYNAHQVTEYVVEKDVVKVEEAIIRLLDAQTEKYEYVYEKETYNPYRTWYQSSIDYAYANRKPSTTSSSKKSTIPLFYYKEMELTLEVILNSDYGHGYDEYEEEVVVTSTGNSKAECWANLFLEHTDLCFDDIVDYTFS